LPSVAAMDQHAVVTALGPTIQRYLTEALP
jgi:hypothetical protein